MKILTIVLSMMITFHITMASTITLSESSKRIVENITKMICDLMKLKVTLIATENQGTTKQQRELHFLNQILKNYSKIKKDVLNEPFEYTPCVTDTDFFTLFNTDEFKHDTIEKEQKEIDKSEKNNEYDVTENNVTENNNRYNDAETESEYELSDVDEEETNKVNKVLAKAYNKLKRVEQSKKYIYIVTPY